jgi:ribonuclease P protein component
MLSDQKGKQRGSNLTGVRMSLVKQFAYSRRQRLDTHAVSVVLKVGKRLASPHRNTAPVGVLFTSRVYKREPEASLSAATPFSSIARLAIAAPKRLFKQAVDRNRIKRWVREAFRQHPLRHFPVDVLITVNAKAALVKLDHQVALKAALMLVLDASARESAQAPGVTPIVNAGGSLPPTAG